MAASASMKPHTILETAWKTQHNNKNKCEDKILKSKETSKYISLHCTAKCILQQNKSPFRSKSCFLFLNQKKEILTDYDVPFHAFCKLLLFS